VAGVKFPNFPLTLIVALTILSHTVRACDFLCKFRRRRLTRRTDFPLECKISAIWRPTDLESIPLASTHTSIIPTRFEVDTIIHCRVLALLSADTSRDLVTLNIDLLNLNRCYTWRVMCPTFPPSMKTHVTSE